MKSIQPTRDPVCILFSHIQARPAEYDLVDVEASPSWKSIEQYQKRLSVALEEQRTMLFLFYDAGWIEYMNLVGEDLDFEKLAKSLQAALRMSDRCEKGAGRDSWLRVITTKQLSYFVNTIRGDQPGETALRWRRFFISDEKRIFYDCSKVVEAIIRLRHLGSGIPVLRIDKDVLDALAEDSRGTKTLAKMLDRAKRNHRHCVESTDAYSFVFSGGYCDEGEEKIFKPRGFSQWSTSYSTRVYPALFATKALLEHAGEELLSDFAATVDKGRAFSEPVARRFYGLDSKTPAGIVRFGAHPRISVISGSLFCLSDGAILDLPPFSNFKSNVVWIDDHLKYALLKNLQQVGQKPIIVPSLDHSRKERKLTARIPHCYLPKGRQTIGNFGFYVLGSYLPSLLRGMIVDRWIYFDPKEKFSAVPAKKPGALTSALRAALGHGRLEEIKREQLRHQLRDLAFDRIEKVWKAWRRLGWRRTGGKEQVRETFASIWVDGRVQEYCREIGASLKAPPDKKHPAGSELPQNWIGWGLLKAPVPDSKTITYDQLADVIKQDLDTLIEDTITYVDWALQWPQFVQAVRVLESKAGAFDLRGDWG